MTERLALVVSYDGSAYHGFQYQNDALPTVQRDLERALSRIADHEVRLTCAGRTDAGVHATHQVVHFDAENHRDAAAWVRGTNRYLGAGVTVTWAGAVSGEFDARFSALARRYLYLIYNNPVRSSLMYRQLTLVSRSLDERAMDLAARALVGEHDFSSFRASQCQAKTPVRTVTDVAVYRRGDVVALDITANAFLHHMVRNIAGVLIDVGRGKLDVADVASVLAARDRRAAGMTAPAGGLYLVDVAYPDEFGIPPGPDLPHLYSLMAS